MIFSSNFFPCIDYMRNIFLQNEILLNVAEQYQKQSYHTRAYVLGPHQVETLNVPVRKYKNNAPISSIVIDYSESWNVKAWKTLTNSYRNSPYFEFFENYLEELFTTKYERLIDLNHDSLTICLKLLGVNKTICQQEFPYYDFKNQFISFNAKKRLENSDKLPYTEYRQNFGNKFEFNLSILDLLLMKGRGCLEILKPDNQIENI